VSHCHGGEGETRMLALRRRGRDLMDATRDSLIRRATWRARR
jgi:hypothetical protein